MEKQKVVCVVGPTASGKTALAVELALRYNGEVVSADSMQIYKHMDIGTAKPTRQEMRGIKHHMLDIVEPGEEYSVARYVEDAEHVIEDIAAQGKLPVIAGGTGFYIDSLLRGKNFAGNIGDKSLRDEFVAFAERQGVDALHAKLAQVDPESAARLHPNDIKRVVRALEVYYTTGETISQHNQNTQQRPVRYQACMLGLTFRDRQKLYDRIDRRVDQMLRDGLLDEVQRLIENGVDAGSTALQAIGYKELAGFLHGDESYAEAVETLKRATRRYAKRQLTWFRRDPAIAWLEMDNVEKITDLLPSSTKFMKSCGIIE